MTIAYLSNEFMLHFSFLADELYRLTDRNFWYIEANEIGEETKFKLPSTFDVYKKPYLIQAWKNEKLKNQAIEIVKNVDVLLIGAGYIGIDYERIRLKTGKLTFEATERLLKRGFFNAFSKLSRESFKLYLTTKHKNVYRLCSSAFTANDVYLLYPFLKGRCYKWGYFTKVPHLNIADVLSERQKNSCIKILCNARLINWKRIDMPIKMARLLKDEGYDIKLNIIGEGVLKDELNTLINDLGLSEIVSMLGRISNESVYKLMREHDIFVFTSNKREGWGAVLNEAMSNGCACVVSDLIGSAPYLIKDNENGLLFKTGDVADLTEKVSYLINHPNIREQMQRAAYDTMLKIWNPRNAAEKLIELSNNLLNDKALIIEEGPCSRAEPIKGKTFSS